jgi:hypothetical protein
MQQVWALSQIEHAAVVPEPPAAPLIPPVPGAPVPVPVVPPVPVPLVPPVPVPLVPPVPPPVQEGTPWRQLSNCAQSEILRQFDVADSIADALGQEVPLWPPVPLDDEQIVLQAEVAVAVLASARHISSFTHSSLQVSVLPEEELEPHPCTAPSANAAARTDPITAETVFLDIARYLLWFLYEGPEGITASQRSAFRV